MVVVQNDADFVGVTPLYFSIQSSPFSERALIFVGSLDLLACRYGKCKV